jgi:uncharacterized protein (DUF58 family)
MDFRFLLIAALTLGLFLAGLLSQTAGVIILTIPLILYVASAFLAGPHSAKIEAKRSLSRDRASQGAEVEVLLEINNAGFRLEEVLIEESLPPGLEVLDGETSAFCTLSPNQKISLAYRVRGVRGHYRFSGVQVTASDHLGIFRKKTFLSVQNRLFILPRVHKLKKIEIRPRYTRIYSGTIPARLGGPGVEFHGVRPYQPGDPLRWINARATARRPEAIYINEFEQERVADVGLILDARSLSNMPCDQGSLMDYSIDAAAALSDFLLENGNRVGLLIYGGPIRWTFPRYGKIQKERILQSLAAAELGANPIFEDLGYIPTRLFPRHTQLIVLSPLVEEDLPVLLKLRARGYPVVIISPDPIDYERRQLGEDRRVLFATQIARLEREFLLKQLRQAGISIVDWNLQQPFHHVANQVLSRPQLLARAIEARR